MKAFRDRMTQKRLKHDQGNGRAAAVEGFPDVGLPEDPGTGNNPPEAGEEGPVDQEPDDGEGGAS